MRCRIYGKCGGGFMENVKEIFPELYKLSKSQTVRIYASNMTYPPSVAGLRH
jgi:hypothetical protein